MPLLDPSLTILTNPLFLDKFSVVRRTVTVVGGRTKADTNTTPTVGVVYVSGDNSTERSSDASTGHKAIDIITRFRLQGQVENIEADLVVWAGNNYLVDTVEDYTRYGAGWVQAHAISQDVIDKKAGSNG